jgi:trk system potassium uptake protein
MGLKKYIFRKKENIFKSLFILSDRLDTVTLWLRNFCRFCFLVTVLIFFITFIYHIGFTQLTQDKIKFETTFRILFLILAIVKFLPEIFLFKKNRPISKIFQLLLLLFTLGVLLTNFKITNNSYFFWNMFYGNTIIIIAIFLLIISEISVLLKILSKVKIPPALVFSGSFATIIFIGTGLLSLPNAQAVPVKLVDTLFTSTSAVCVTGLTVVDTADAFTDLGKIIILILIQIGGLGIMTVAGFFSYIFTSQSTLNERLLLKDLLSSQTLGNLFKILIKIVLLTFIIEFFGALIIYSSLTENESNKILFSAFHSVSAFCNAGFSTLSKGLNSKETFDNYSLQTAVAILIILGGIGFPVLMRFYTYLKFQVIHLVKKFKSEKLPAKQNPFGIESRIVIITTLILIFGGTIFYFLLEKEKSFIEMDNLKKIFVSFFNSVTARTAGFNINDISSYSYPAVFLTILLMWIGASPGSTGGGIKTTTIAIALNTVWINIKGKQNLEISKREISAGTISRVLSIILLSIITIGIGFFCLLLTEQGKNPVYLLFESVSAFCTVGLSMIDTSTLSQTSKIIIMLLMFTGRIGPLTLLIGFLYTKKRKYYKYPVAEIVIN